MLRAILGIGKLQTVMILLLVAVFFSGCTSAVWSEPKNVIKGDTKSAKLLSLAEVINAKNEDFLYVSFNGYNEQIETWEFSIFVPRHTEREVFSPVPSAGGLDPGGELLGDRYFSAIEKIFVEASNIITENGEKVTVTVLFRDMTGRVESSNKLMLIAADPGKWSNYMSKPDQAIVIPESALQGIIQKAMTGRQ